MEPGMLKGGRYRIVRLIGSGGMSQVFEAFDESLRRSVALKVLHPHLAADAEARARFSREAEATARLKHPNIVEIYDVASMDSPDAFIVTELVRGTTLRDALDRHRFAPPAALSLAVMDSLADALAHAHAAGVIHRDLKPENMMIAEDGTLKLMDFGIARILDDRNRMTMTGALVGSPLHMAPEIIEGAQATAASDIFSAGTIFYWLVAGEPPFAGQTAAQTIRNIAETTPEAPDVKAPFLSKSLSALILRCLDKNPAARPQNGGELKAELARHLSEEGVSAPQELIRGFLENPEATSEALTGQALGRLLGAAEQNIASGPQKLPQAVSLVSRALALAPDSPKAAELLSAIDASMAKERRRLAAKKILTALAALSATLGICAFAGFQAGLWGKAPAHLPTAAAEADAGEKESARLSPPVGAKSPSASPSSLSSSPEAANETEAPELSETDAGGAVVPGENIPLPNDAGEAADAAAPADASEPSPAPDKTEPASAAEAKSQRQKQRGDDGAPKNLKRDQRNTGVKKSPEHSAAPTAPEKTAARDAPREAEGAEAATGSLSVVLHHADRGLTWGKILIDGVGVNANSPSWSGELKVGIHKVEAEAPCCLPEKRTIEIQEGNANPPLVFRLRSKPATLSVQSAIPCEIWLEGVRRASCESSIKDPVAVPLAKNALRQRVSLRLVREGLADAVLTEEFEAGQQKFLQMDASGQIEVKESHLSK